MTITGWGYRPCRYHPWRLAQVQRHVVQADGRSPYVAVYVTVCAECDWAKCSNCNRPLFPTAGACEGCRQPVERFSL